MKQYGLAIESWGHPRKLTVTKWLEANFGPEGERWGTQYDYGLDNLYMDEDVYLIYLLKWT
jgi:hypothetical protein